MIIKQYSDDGTEIRVIEIKEREKKAKWTKEYKAEYMKKYREQKKEQIASYYQIQKLSGNIKYTPTGNPKGRPRKYNLEINNGCTDINTNSQSDNATN